MSSYGTSKNIKNIFKNMIVAVHMSIVAFHKWRGGHKTQDGKSKRDKPLKRSIKYSLRSFLCTQEAHWTSDRD